MADSSSTSSSSPSHPPRAFLLAVALVLATESALAAAVPPHPGRHEVDALLHRVDVRPPATAAVVFGDSVTLRALDGTPATAHMEDLCTNMAVGFPGNALLLRRVLESDSRLRVAFFVLLPDTWEYGMNTERAMTYFESCFLRVPELALLWKARGPNRQFLRAIRNRFLTPPSVRRRGVFFAEFPFFDTVRVHEPAPVFPWLPDVRRAATDVRASFHDFAASPITLLYASDVLNRTREAGVRVVLLTAPVQKHVFEAWRSNGRLRQYEEFLESVRREWDHVEVVPPETFAHFPGEFFYDPVHLQGMHQARYGRELSDLLLRLMDGRLR